MTESKRGPKPKSLPKEITILRFLGSLSEPMITKDINYAFGFITNRGVGNMLHAMRRSGLVKVKRMYKRKVYSIFDGDTKLYAWSLSDAGQELLDCTSESSFDELPKFGRKNNYFIQDFLFLYKKSFRPETIVDVY